MGSIKLQSVGLCRGTIENNHPQRTWELGCVSEALNEPGCERTEYQAVTATHSAPEITEQPAIWKVDCD
jgi:hypothetical protein